MTSRFKQRDSISRIESHVERDCLTAWKDKLCFLHLTNRCLIVLEDLVIRVQQVGGSN